MEKGVKGSGSKMSDQLGQVCPVNISNYHKDGGSMYQQDMPSSSRQNWSHKMDFVLSCLSYAVGLGNVWRFPYVCYKNGGGAFLIPFIVMLFVTGIPLVFLELSFGQFASSGVVSIWSVSPIFQGVGWAMFVVSCLIAIYYNMIIAWTLRYLFSSFSQRLPWSYCGEWSSSACLLNPAQMNNCSQKNGFWSNNTCFYPELFNQTSLSLVDFNETSLPLMSSRPATKYKSASEEYFYKGVLGISEGIHSLGGLQWELVLCLLLAWVLVCACLIKGIKSSGKAVYFTAFFPYLVLTILLIRGATLEGSGTGIAYYLTPQWDHLFDVRVWKDAAVQTFFSLSPCWGGLITLSSYNKFHNNCLLDAVLVSVLDCLTSIFAGFVIFSIIGYMAHELNQSVESVASDGPGLAFIIYPAVVTRLPVSHLWALLFFSMLITLGLGTQIATVTTVHTTLVDQFPQCFKSKGRSSLLLILISLIGYLVGLSFCTQGGMYVVQLFDNYAATYSLLAIGLIECLALSWVYGTERLFDDIHMMLGKYPSKVWAFSWRFVVPIALLAILIFTWIDFDHSKCGDYTFPEWADGIGILLTMSSVLAIPLVAIWKVLNRLRHHPGQGFIKVVKKLSRPSTSWGPRLPEHRVLMKEYCSSSLPSLDLTQSVTSSVTLHNGL